MQPLASAMSMQGFDRTAIHSAGIPGLILMENAGRAFVEELARRAVPIAGRSIVVVCGKGNNGGDGFVIARHLANRGCDVRVFLLGKKPAVRGDAKVNLEAAVKMARFSGVSLRIEEVTGHIPSARNAVIIVDAVLGTGFTGEVRGLYREAIEWINRQGAFVAAVDLPSGVDATTGAVGSVAVRAHLTVTMGVGKIGLYVGAGADMSGEVRVADLGAPGAIFDPGEDPVFRIVGEDIARKLPVRPRNANKYTAGKVLVVAGSRTFTGAPFMTAQAAMRSGAGAVVLAIPESIHGALARRLTEVILVPLVETPDGTLGQEAFAPLRARADWADVVALGPGLSRNGETLELVRSLLASVRKPVIVDADALSALEDPFAILRKRKAPTILTPHTGEFAALTGMTPEEADRFRVSAARDAARAWKCVVVLKGAPTVTARADGTVFINSTGNPGMATIGSGDVLTGLIAGLHAQGMETAQAAYAGVYLHGAAGDLSSQRRGRRGMLATDMIDSLAAAFKQSGG